MVGVRKSHVCRRECRKIVVCSAVTVCSGAIFTTSFCAFVTTTTAIIRYVLAPSLNRVFDCLRSLSSPVSWLATGRIRNTLSALHTRYYVIIIVAINHLFCAFFTIYTFFFFDNCTSCWLNLKIVMLYYWCSRVYNNIPNINLFPIFFFDNNPVSWLMTLCVIMMENS